MPFNRPVLVPILMALAAAPAVAAPPAGDGARDEELVVARSVMPRIAYHALEPTANPVRVQATVFPGRIFHGVIGGLVGSLASDHELGDRVPLVVDLPAGTLEPGLGGLMHHDGPRLGAGSLQGSRSGAASIGGSVLRMTSGIGDRIGKAVSRSTTVGGGP